MNGKQHELLAKGVLSQKELETLEEDEEVIELNTLGASGLYVGFTWFNVVTGNNRYDVYCKL